MRIDLLVIDGENDFCASGNEPLDWPWPKGGRRRGSLFVEGADEEAVKLGEMIKRLANPKLPRGHSISTIFASMDAHHLNDCSHNTAWKDKNGNSPPPFTIISVDDVVNQVWIPRFPAAMFDGKLMPSYEWAKKYTQALHDTGRNPLCVWPVHCQIGTWGGNIYHPLAEAFDNWCSITNGYIDYITKGQWPFTEHYSALRADVIDSSRPETQLNISVVQSASAADMIVWSGWAGSHCLRWTALDAVNHFGSGENQFIKKCVFLEDASASVPDIPGAPFKFSDWRKQFLDEMSNRGAKITTTDKFLAK